MWNTQEGIQVEIKATWASTKSILSDQGSGFSLKINKINPSLQSK